MKFSGFATSLLLAVALKAAEPEPPVVTPGAENHLPPSDAIVLFDGKDLSKWQSMDGGEAKWEVKDGAMQVTKTGSIRTREEFGDVQLHIEWASPGKVEGEGQGRGNSGVYLMGRYEIQVLDSYQNKTYPNGQAASFYGHNAPLVNASRPSGEWQAYDIIFHRPKKADDDSVIPGSFTVLHNGVLVQDHIPIKGGATTAAAFQNLAEKGPLVLQDHGNPVRFRNIWVRQLSEAARSKPTTGVFINTFGEHKVGNAVVTADSDTRKISVGFVSTKQSPQGSSTSTTTMGPIWTLEDGWFAFVQDEGRLVWLHDGAGGFLLQERRETPERAINTTYGTNNLPIAIPEAVLERLNKDLRSKIATQKR